MKDTRITSYQIRAGRMLLGWDQRTMAEKSEVSIDTIKRLEALRGPVSGKDETIFGVQTALERGGIVLLYKDDHGGLGVRFRE